MSASGDADRLRARRLGADPRRSWNGGDGRGRRPRTLHVALTSAAVLVGVVVAIQAGAPAGPTWEAVGLAAAAVALAAATARLHPPAPPTPRAGAGAGPTPAEERHVRLRRRVRSATVSGAGVRQDLRPVLRDLAAALLDARHGVDLDRDRAAARSLLGARLDDLVRPVPSVRADQAPVGADRTDGSGLSPAEIAALLDRLERL